MDLKINQIQQAAPVEHTAQVSQGDSTFKFTLVSHIEEAELQTKLQGLMQAITEEGLALIRDHYNMPYRVQTVSVRLLEMHAEYARMLAKALIPKAQGNDEEADLLYAEMKNEMGKKEIYFETCYDHTLAFYSLESIFKKRTNKAETIIY